MKRRLMPCITLLAFLLLAVPAAASGPCNSPPIPVSDVIQVGFSSFHLFDPLMNDRDSDGDRLTLSSIASPPACAGTIQMEGNLVKYTPSGSVLPGGGNSCTVSYSVSDGAETRSSSVVLVFPNGEIFSDDFESGNLGAWSEVVQ